MNHEPQMEIQLVAFLPTQKHVNISEEPQLVQVCTLIKYFARLRVIERRIKSISGVLRHQNVCAATRAARAIFLFDTQCNQNLVFVAAAWVNATAF